MERIRTYGWAHPTTLAAGASVTDGLEYSRQLAAADDGLTPIFATLGYRLVEVEPAHSRYTGSPAEHLRHALGMIDGGYAATILDSAAATAVHSTIPAGTGYTTMSHTVRYLRPITEETGPVTAIGRLVSRSDSAALARADLRDNTGRLLAQATNACIILAPKAGAR